MKVVEKRTMYNNKKNENPGAVGRTAPATAQDKLMNEVRLRAALESVADTMRTDPRDWSLYKRDAWLYGILAGWSEESLEELRRIHN